VTPGENVADLAQHISQSPRLGLLHPTDYTVTTNLQTGALKLVESSSLTEEVVRPLASERLVSSAPLPEETTFVEQRFESVKNAQEAYCKKTLSRPLSIGICASGGGFRAMLATAGLFCALEEMGMLPLIHTCTGLSGSTWFLFPWILSGLSAGAFTQELVTWLERGIIHHVNQQYQDFAHVIGQKKQCGQPISGIDLYGISLAHTLLKPLSPSALRATIQDTSRLIDPAKHPLIRGSAVSRSYKASHYEWVLVSPFSTWLLADNLFIPSHSLGSHFFNGYQTTAPPAPLMGYLLGIFGSSFSINLRDLLERLPLSLSKIITSMLPADWQNRPWSNTKVTAAKVPNPRRGMPETLHNSDKKLALVDGGYLNNLPLEPTIRSATQAYDLLIVMDSKQEQPGRLKNLEQACNALRSQGAQWITIAQEEVAQKPVSFHGGTDGGPLIMYCTVEGESENSFNPASDPAYATPRLLYSKEKAERLVNHIKEMVKKQRSALEEAIHRIASGL